MKRFCSDPGWIVFCVSASGISVDDLLMQLVGLRYTEPDLTISYPGFLYLLMKLDSMIRKGGRRGRREGGEVEVMEVKYGWRQERKKKKKRGGGEEEML